jgi:hypothetical protein
MLDILDSKIIHMLIYIVTHLATTMYVHNRGEAQTEESWNLDNHIVLVTTIGHVLDE